MRSTPADRDRVVDLLRGTSLVAVALGHWLIAVVRPSGDGGIVATSALAEVPAVQLLTWLFQVMPLFFLVGGVANARSWASATARGDGYGAWLDARLRRLVVPAAAAAVVWTVLAAALVSTDAFPAPLVALAGLNLTIPLWFLAVYVLVVAAAPAMLALHRRHGLAVPVALTVVAIAVDVAHRAGVPLVGWCNYAAVWLVPQQLGFAWADGRLAGRRVGAVCLGVGGVALVTATLLGPYPVSVVHVPGEAASNTTPPTVVLLALLLAQFGAVGLGHARLRRWLERPRVWAAVVVVNARALTVFLWHMPAMVLAAAVLVPAGLVLDADPGSAPWWWSRPVWLAQLAVALAVLLPLVRPLERLGVARADATGAVRRVGPIGATAALVASAGGFGTLAAVGLPVAGTPAPTPAIWGLAALSAAAVILTTPGRRVARR